MSAAYALNFSSTVSGVFPVLAALFNYKRLDKVLKIAALFFLVSSIFDWTLELTKLSENNNLRFIHLFIVVSIVFFGAIYYHSFIKPMLKKAVLILSGVVLLIIIFNLIFVESITDYPSISITVLSVELIFFSLAYFYQLLTRQEFMHIEKLGLFWINAGILLYFSINIFLFMLLKHFIDEKNVDFYMIHSITNIIANLLYSAGLLCKPQRTT